MSNHEFKIGDRISYQIAGMTAPEYGTINAFARVPEYMFVVFDGDVRGKLTPIDECRLGKLTSWWRQDINGKWWNNLTHPDPIPGLIKQASQRISAGEPFNTTAAELGLTPSELKEFLK